MDRTEFRRILEESIPDTDTYPSMTTATYMKEAKKLLYTIHQLLSLTSKMISTNVTEEDGFIYFSHYFKTVLFSAWQSCMNGAQFSGKITPYIPSKVYLLVIYEIYFAIMVTVKEMPFIKSVDTALTCFDPNFKQSSVTKNYFHFTESNEYYGGIAQILSRIWDSSDNIGSKKVEAITAIFNEQYYYDGCKLLLEKIPTDFHSIVFTKESIKQTRIKTTSHIYLLRGLDKSIRFRTQMHTVQFLLKYFDTHKELLLIFENLNELKIKTNTMLERDFAALEEMRIKGEKRQPHMNLLYMLLILNEYTCNHLIEDVYRYLSILNQIAMRISPSQTLKTFMGYNNRYDFIQSERKFHSFKYPKEFVKHKAILSSIFAEPIISLDNNVTAIRKLMRTKTVNLEMCATSTYQIIVLNLLKVLIGIE